MQRALRLIVHSGLVIGAVAMFAISTRFFFYSDVQEGSISGVIVLGVLPIVVGVTMLGSLSWSSERSTALFLSFLALGIAIYGVEVYLQLIPPTRVSVEQNAKNLGNQFDPRQPREFARDLREKLGAAVPAGYGRRMLESNKDGKLTSPIKIAGKEVLPLAGPALTPAVLCNVSGQWVWYWADEQGFNNPKGLWPKLPADLLLVGDSFVHGICVPPGKTIADHVREVVPKTINVGLSGSGPLTSLAILREYGPVAKPKRVLWFFYNNDVTEIELEKRSPLLLKYLIRENSRMQGLYVRKLEIDAELLPFMNALVQREPKSPSIQGYRISASDAFYLRTLRHRLGIHAGGAKFDYATIKEVLEIAKFAVEAWGGELILVYLPGRPLFDTNRSMISYLRMINSEIKSIAGELEVKMIDVTPHFLAHQNPLSLFDEAEWHYNENGYDWAAQAILNSKLFQNAPIR